MRQGPLGRYSPLGIVKNCKIFGGANSGLPAFREENWL